MPNCVECDEVITNPVCEECMAKEFSAWLVETDAAVEQDFFDYSLKRPVLYTATICVLCGKNMDICPHCTTTQFVSWLKDSKGASLVTSALDFFAGSQARGSIEAFATVQSRLLKTLKAG